VIGLLIKKHLCIGRAVRTCAYRRGDDSLHEVLQSSRQLSLAIATCKLSGIINPLGNR
jgi:hypothetical protein